MPISFSRIEKILENIIGYPVTVEQPNSRIEELLIELGVIIADGGTKDYDDLTNKPQINSVTLSGNKSLSDLGIVNPMLLKGRVDSVSDLPNDAEVGWLYLVGPVTDTNHKEYVYTAANTWEFIGYDNIVIDSSLSTTSENPVQNKVITTALAGKLDSVPVATAQTVGGIKPGSSFTVSNDGTTELNPAIAGDGITVSIVGALPGTYQACEYISGALIINTGFKDQMIVSIDASFAQTGAYLLGFDLAANQYFGIDDQNRITAEWTLDDYVEGADSSQRNMIRCRFENGQRTVVSVDGVADTSTGYSSGIVSNYANLSPFKLGLSGYTTSMTLYGCTLTDLSGSTVYRNFIPCYSKADPTVIGLYDTVGSTFYAAAGATKGPDIVLPGGQLKIDVPIDNSLSTLSENPVQNKVVATAITDINTTIGDINTVLEGVL